MENTNHFWKAIETLSTSGALLIHWRSYFASDFDTASSFIRPTQEQSQSYPCTNRFRCQCCHRVIVHSPTRIVAVCQCGEDCDRIPLEPKDLIIWKLDETKLCEAIRRTFGFEPCAPDQSQTWRSARRIGTWGTLHLPVFYFAPINREAFQRESQRLFNSNESSFVLLTPTQAHYTPEIEAAMKRHRSALVPLSRTLTLDGEKFTITNSIEPILREIERQLTEGNGLAKTVEKIGRDIAAVAQGTYELQTAKARLEQMQGENLFKFVQKIDADAFRIVCAVLAHGDIAKASRALDIKDSTLRLAIKGWEKRGGPYRALVELVRWRKESHVSGTVPFNDALLYENSGEANRESLLADLLDGLLSMTESNWQDIADELTDLLKSSGAHAPRV